MSEVDTRPAPSRGRSSVRGGRGGFGRGGPRGGHRQANGTAKEHEEPSLDDQGDIGDMKKQYSSQLPVLKDMFPEWTDVDLVFALQETGGDLETTILHITEGHISQFSEIKKPKDRARSKAKEGALADHAQSSTRGGRGRGGFEAGRGGRGRGDRARGASRGGRGGAAAPPKDNAADAIPTTAPEASAWGSTAADASTGWGDTAPTDKETPHTNVVAAEHTPKTASEGAKPSLLPEGSAKKTWASMFNQPKPPPAPKQVAQPPPPQVAAPEPEPEVPIIEEPAPAVEPELPEPEEEKPIEAPVETEIPTPALEPPHDPLTEDNLENLPDTSIPPATHTVASTVGSVDARQATPLTGPQAPIGRPTGGYASTALRVAALGGRSASFQRRVMEQQEAVVLPGHNSVDRAAVQFGSMGLNADGTDVDEEREEPETRTQAPPLSPPSQPRAALPPSAASQPQELMGGQQMPTPKQAPGLPPLASQQQQYPQSGAQELPGGMPQQSYSQYGRYGQQEAPAAQKTYDPFSHQTPAYDQFSQGQGQAQSQQQHHAQQPQAQQSQQTSQAQSQPGQHAQESSFGAYSSAPSDYSQYYTADQQRYQNYYGSQYGQQQSQGHQDSHSGQQRSGHLGAGQDSGFGGPQSAQQQQSRYNEPQGSGQNTPNPASAQQQQPAPSQQQQQHQQSQYGAGYPYGHPYYTSPYAAAYQNQFTGYGQQQYGSSPYGNKGMYGQPQGYGMSAPSSYDQSSTSANGSGFGQQPSMQSRDSGLGAGASDYGRTSSTQPSSVGASGFGGASDYGRHSSYQGQQPGYGSQQGGASDELKSYDSKTGPSPGLGQPGRPGSAVNSAGQQGQSGLPQGQSQGQAQGHQQQQPGFGGYPGFNQSSGYGSGLGGLGGHQQQQGQGQYGGYGGGFGQSYGQYSRGWGGQGYGH